MKSTSNQELAKELHKPIIEKSRKSNFIYHLKTIFGVLL